MKKIIISFAVISLLAVGCGTSDAPTGATPTNPEESVITMADVQQANSAENCLSVVDGSVYNLTDWINMHPGGPQKILAICGTDATSVFNNQHGADNGPVAALENFKIGELSKLSINNTSPTNW